MRTRKNHIHSQFRMKYFIEKDFLYKATIHGEPQRQNIKNAMMRNNYWQQDVEQYHGNLENKVAPIFDKIIASVSTKISLLDNHLMNSVLVHTLNKGEDYNIIIDYLNFIDTIPNIAKKSRSGKKIEEIIDSINTEFNNSLLHFVYYKSSHFNSEFNHSNDKLVLPLFTPTPVLFPKRYKTGITHFIIHVMPITPFMLLVINNEHELALKPFISFYNTPNKVNRVILRLGIENGEDNPFISGSLESIKLIQRQLRNLNDGQHDFNVHIGINKSFLNNSRENKKQD